MLGDNDVMATVAVKDLKAASQFYEGTLELNRDHGDPDSGAIGYKSGNSTVLVYQSQYAGTNQATAATWVVDDVTAMVKALGAKGVKFEHYDFPGMTLEGEVHVMGDGRAAWFKDPEGNILAIVNR